jgi:matrixin
MQQLWTLIALVAFGASTAGTVAADPLVGAAGATTIQGHPALVFVLVRAPSEAGAAELAGQALASRGAKRLREEPLHAFTRTFDLAWPQFAIAPRKKQSVAQYYNANGDPTGAGLLRLLGAQATWSKVKSSAYGMSYAGTTTRCPSLFFECGEWSIDGFNDVGWVSLEEPFVLAVTSLVWNIESGDVIEADVALNLAAEPWSLDGVGGSDLQTVLLHELGHVAGLDHVSDPAAVMYPVINGVVRNLSASEIEGISWIYPVAAHAQPGHPVHPASPISAEVVAELGRPAPGGGAYECSFEVIDLAATGAAAWGSDVDLPVPCVSGGAGAISQALFMRTAASAPTVELARSGRSAPAGGNYGAGFVGAPAMNGVPEVAFSFALEPFELPLGRNAGLYVFRAGATSALVQPDAAAASGGALLRGSSDPSIDANGWVSFTGITDTTAGVNGFPLGAGVYRAHAAFDEIEAVVAPGDAAPGGGTFAYAGFGAANDRGDIAFDAHVSNLGPPPPPPPPPPLPPPGAPSGPSPQTAVGPSPPSPQETVCPFAQDFQLGCLSGVWIRRSGVPEPEPIALQGQPTPFGSAFEALHGTALNNRGEVVFAGQFVDRLGPASGLFVHDGGTLRAVARSDQDAPQGGRFAFERVRRNVRSWAINDLGDIAFVAPLVLDLYGDGFVNNGVYVQTGDRMVLVARTGTRVIGLGTIRVIGAFIEPDSDDGFFLRGLVRINERREILFPAQLTDGRTLLLKARF